VLVTFTDLSLPGNNGRALQFQRSFDIKSNVWTFGLAGLPLSIEDASTPFRRCSRTADAVRRRSAPPIRLL
jgi:hypothetical protein